MSESASNALAALQELEVEELAKYAGDVQIHGTIVQFVTLSLGLGQTLLCSRGALMACEDGVDWELRIPGGAGKAISRMMSGEGVTITHCGQRLRAPRWQVPRGGRGAVRHDRP